MLNHAGVSGPTASPSMCVPMLYIATPCFFRSCWHPATTLASHHTNIYVEAAPPIAGAALYPRLVVSPPPRTPQRRICRICTDKICDILASSLSPSCSLGCPCSTGHPCGGPHGLGHGKCFMRISIFCGRVSWLRVHAERLTILKRLVYVAPQKIWPAGVRSHWLRLLGTNQGEGE